MTTVRSPQRAALQFVAFRREGILPAGLFGSSRDAEVGGGTGGGREPAGCLRYGVPGGGRVGECAGGRGVRLARSRGGGGPGGAASGARPGRGGGAGAGGG